MHSGFGFVEIDGVTYTHDIVIHTDGTISKRKKKKSKELKVNMAIRHFPAWNWISLQVKTLI